MSISSGEACQALSLSCEKVRRTLTLSCFKNIVDPHTHSIGMSFQLLILSHADHGRTDGADAFSRKMLESNLAIVGIEIYSIIGKGVTVGRERVVSATGIVASRLTSILTEEHTASIYHLFGK